MGRISKKRSDVFLTAARRGSSALSSGTTHLCRAVSEGADIGPRSPPVVFSQLISRCQPPATKKPPRFGDGVLTGPTDCSNACTRPLCTFWYASLLIHFRLSIENSILFSLIAQTKKISFVIHERLRETERERERERGKSAHFETLFQEHKDLHLCKISEVEVAVLVRYGITTCLNVLGNKAAGPKFAVEL